MEKRNGGGERRRSPSPSLILDSRHSPWLQELVASPSDSQHSPKLCVSARRLRGVGNQIDGERLLRLRHRARRKSHAANVTLGVVIRAPLAGAAVHDETPAARVVLHEER